MSNASSESVTEGNHAVSWDPWAAILLSAVFFLLPQVAIGALLPIFEFISPGLAEQFFGGTNIALNFIFYGAAELLSVWCLISYLRRKKKINPLKALKLNKPKATDILYALPAFGIYFLLAALMFLVATSIFPSINIDEEQIVGFESAASNLELLLAFVALVMVAPIVEELLFRGFLFQGVAKQWGFLFGAVLTSLLFGLAHGQINVGIDTFTLSLVLCWLLKQTNNLWSPIALHSLKNFIAFLIIFVIDLPV